MDYRIASYNPLFGRWNLMASLRRSDECARAKPTHSSRYKPIEPCLNVFTVIPGNMGRNNDLYGIVRVFWTSIGRFDPFDVKKTPTHIYAARVHTNDL